MIQTFEGASAEAIGADRDPAEDSIVRWLRDGAGREHLVGKDPGFLREIRKIPVVARSESSVLICGETGTGKEVCARVIHSLSRRSRAPFVAVNCGALPVDLVENELFGHESEAFTGAATSRPGMLLEAEQGTLFLDEIDSLPAQAQVKLLRFLQEREFRPLGSSRTRKADVRVLAATNIASEELVGGKTIRRDLYYRLNVIALRLPSLRERPVDIALLAEHFLSRWKGISGPRSLSADALRRLAEHDWPGNIRELEHVIERAVVFASRSEIQTEDLGLPPPAPPPALDLFASPFQVAKARVVEDFERHYLERLLRAHRGNISRAACVARKNRRAFFELIRKHGIDAEAYREPAA